MDCALGVVTERVDRIRSGVICRGNDPLREVNVPAVVRRHFGYDEDAIAETCPNTEEVFNHRFTHLPLYDITQEQLEYMADAILESIDEMKRGV